MASETHLTSDSEDTFIFEVSEESHRKFMKSKLIDCLMESENITLQIIHKRDQRAQMILNLGSKPEVPLGAQKKMPARILVRNYPLCFNEECFRMFFDNEIGLGTGSVKAVKLYKKDKTAVVEFENDSSVEAVLREQSVKILGTAVNIERYAPYLEKSESLLSASVSGLGRKLSDDIKKLNMDALEKGRIDSSTAAEKEIKQLKENVEMIKQKNEMEVNRLKDDVAELEQELHYY